MEFQEGALEAILRPYTWYQVRGLERQWFQDPTIGVERLWAKDPTGGSPCEYRETLVSVRVLEEIPWFRALR